MVIRNVRDNEGRVLIEVLDALRSRAQGSNAITVHILAAADHDGVCASTILVTVLQLNGIKFSLSPVTGNTDIQEHFQQLGEDDEVRSMVLLNCGASIDLQLLLEECRAPAEIVCFVIDSHRPFLLDNLSEHSPRVIVLDDDPISEASGVRPPVNDNESEASDGEGASSGSEAEKENNWDPDAPPKDGEGGLGAMERVADRIERKRRRAKERSQRQDRKRQRQNEYYLSSYFAAPAAVSLFKMAKQAAPPSQELLWLAAVSLTGYYDLGLLSEVEYVRMASEELKEALDRTTDFSSLSSQSSGGTVPEPNSALSDDEAVPSGRAMPRRAPRKRRLRYETDLRLTMYKHWTIEESMLHSSYFYGSLELHREKGLRALKSFFATVGISPSDYTQQYSCMSMKVRNKLQQMFRDHGNSYGLSDRMFIQQFVRDVGQSWEVGNAMMLHEISCVDAAHMVTAILSSVPPDLDVARIDSLPQLADGRRDPVAVHELEKKELVENFWRASAAVLCKDPQTLRNGVLEAVDAAKAVQTLARRLIDSHAVKFNATRQFRWCKVDRPPHLFRHHLATRRLAVWLLHVLYTHRPRSEGPGERPLLVVIRDHIRQTYLCVGASPTHLAEQNEFGNRFRAAVKADSSLKYRYDFFDKSCIEVHEEDFERFWSLLESSSL